MLTGSAGRPLATTPLTQMAVGHSSPSRCTVTSEVGVAGGQGGPSVRCPWEPVLACVLELEQDRGTGGVLGVKS